MFIIRIKEEDKDCCTGDKVEGEFLCVDKKSIITPQYRGLFEIFRVQNQVFAINLEEKFITPIVLTQSQMDKFLWKPIITIPLLS